MKRLWWILLLVLPGLPVAYLCTKGSTARGDNESRRQGPPTHLYAADSCRLLLRDGDLLLRRGNDATSMAFAQLNQRDQRYSHCGIVMVEQGYPFVYHSIGGEENPDRKLRRDSFQHFIDPANNLAFGIARYDMDSERQMLLRRFVTGWYAKRPMFDTRFDLSTDDRVYCAEFVYKALAAAYTDSTIIDKYTLRGFRYIAVDNLFLSPHAHMVWEVRY